MAKATKSKAKKKRPSLRPALIRFGLLALLVALTGVAAFSILFVGPPPERAKKTAPPTRSPEPSKERPGLPPPSARELPRPAIQPQPEGPHAALSVPSRRETSPAVPETPSAALPRLAIIIDDMGFHRHVGHALIAMPAHFSFAFLPHSPFAAELLREARAKKRDILLHLPLEPKDKTWDPGAGALYVSMPRATMARIFSDDLAAVPGAIGVNNHMGSRFTEDPRAMAVLVQLLGEHRLFFLDSYTTGSTVGYDTAVSAGLAVGRRDVFLDNDLNAAAIAGQLEEAVRIARQRGFAVAIGHPKRETLDALRRFVADLPADIEIVAVHRLIKEP